MKYGLSVVAYTLYTNSLPLTSDASYVTVLPPPRDLYVNMGTITDQTLDISFNAPSSLDITNITEYRITATPATGEPTIKDNSIAKSITIDNLLSGMKYGLSVVAYTSYTNSLPLTSDVSYVTLLPPPRDLSVNTITDQSIDISFNDPSINNTTDISFYTITATPALGEPTIKDNTIAKSITIDNLLSGMKYGIRVVANTQYKSSNPLISDASYVTLLPPPRDLSVNTITDQSIDISFNDPIINNTADITKYRVTASPATGSSTIKDNSIAKSVNIDNLLSGMKYGIDVVAYT
jgi:hypothetical protein